MSWIDILENSKFSIKTGDGKTFYPLWKNGEKTKEFNITKYDFINLDKSFIDRKKSQSASYPLVFWFQGEDNLDQAQDFEDSANDNRLWTVEHPFYGTIKGQPSNLKRVDASFNVTEVTVDFWESITEDFPVSNISIKDEVKSKVSALNLTAVGIVSSSLISSNDIPTLRNNLILTEAKFKPDNDFYNDYKNAYSTALKSSSSILSDTENNFKNIQDIITIPSLFNTTVISRIKSFISAYEILKDSVENVFSKTNFESQGSSIISSICLSCLNPIDGDFVTREDVENANSLLLETYDNYLSYLDTISLPISNITSKWSPSVNIQSELNSLVYLTSNHLFTSAFEAKQERTIELKKDSNIILLVHKYMGLDSEDKNLDIFREINNIKNNEIFKIPKGRTIKYFV